MDKLIQLQNIYKIARESFNILQFREFQLDVIESILDHKDTVAIFPTGGGKSATFQIPALMLEGLTLVVTPLISLMKDQIRTLREERHIEVMRLSFIFKNCK